MTHKGKDNGESFDKSTKFGRDAGLSENDIVECAIETLHPDTDEEKLKIRQRINYIFTNKNEIN